MADSDDQRQKELQRRLARLGKLEQKADRLAEEGSRNAAHLERYVTAAAGITTTIQIKTGEDANNFFVLLEERPHWRGRVKVTADKPTMRRALVERLRKKVDAHNARGETLVVLQE